MSMWSKHPLEMNFNVWLCGGVPRSDKVVADWVAVRAATEAALAKMEKNGVGPDARKPKSLEEVTQEHLDTTDKGDPGELLEKSWIGFSRNEAGLFVRGANIRAHLKDQAERLAPAIKAGKVEGLKDMAAFGKKMKDATYIAEDQVSILGADGKPVQQATGYRDAAVHLFNRTCLKRVDYVFPATLKCTILLLDYSPVTIDHIRALLDIGCVSGFGTDRSLQFGRYTYILDGIPGPAVNED